MGRIFDLVEEHTSYRKETINLVPSENIMTESSRHLFCTDLVHRYENPLKVYGGTKYIDEIVEETCGIAKKFLEQNLHL